MLGQISLENNTFQNALGKLDLVYINESNCIETACFKFFQKGMQMFCSLVIGFWALRLREDILRQNQLSAVVLRAPPALNIPAHPTLYCPCLWPRTPFHARQTWLEIEQHQTPALPVDSSILEFHCSCCSPVLSSQVLMLNSLGMV